jgi:uncharacterized SAM-binding protein YcdF (DUF218 family)
MVATASLESRILVKAAVVLLLAFAGLLPEYAYYRGSVAARHDTVASGETCVVFILGFPGRRNGRPSRMQRLRVEAGTRAMKEFHCTRMVISGGAPHSPYIEAKTMGALAVAQGIPFDRLVLEKRARNTWENVKYSLSSLRGFDKVVVVSDGLHVHRGRRYLCKQDPHLCHDVVRATSYRFGRIFWFKLPGFLHEIHAYIRDGVVHS